jgi:hypothetical protein
MLNMKCLKSLPLLLVAYLASPACSLPSAETTGRWERAAA